MSINASICSKHWQLGYFRINFKSIIYVFLWKLVFATLFLVLDINHLQFKRKTTDENWVKILDKKSHGSSVSIFIRKAEKAGRISPLDIFEQFVGVYIKSIFWTSFCLLPIEFFKNAMIEKPEMASGLLPVWIKQCHNMWILIGFFQVDGVIS